MKDNTKCLFCGIELSDTEYIKHLEYEHTYYYLELINTIKELKYSNDFSYHVNSSTKEANEMALINDSVLKESNYLYITNKAIREWEPKNFNLEATTVWSFPNRGAWATHSGEFKGNWSPYIPRNIILRYSKINDVVLDQFIGSGTTLIETKLLKRKGIGVDINKDAIRLAAENLDFDKNEEYQPKLYIGDARNLDFICDESIDLICTHPPYSNIIKYSNNIAGDLSHYDIEDFLYEMKKVAAEAMRVLKHGKHCAILIGDTRKNKNIIPLGFRTMQVFLDTGFILKELIIKHQHNCKSTGFWYEKSIKYNFLLIAHEYLLVLYKP